MASGDHIAVAAIDFGTTFSGWAYSFRHDLKKEESKIIVRNWNSGQHISHKAPTSVLINPDGQTLAAFGYEAEDRYVELMEDGNHGDNYFFQRFKMMLYKQKVIGRKTTIADVTGKRLPAIKVFELSIRFLKDDLLDASSNKLSGGLKESEIHWTLTVPAIWSERAKKFMREAAVKAGIDTHKLTIVLEPEAASIFCRQLPIERSYEGSPVPLNVGDRYVVVDCGGGTVDICCHEIISGDHLKEVYSVKGEALGGTSVDIALEKMMVDLFGDKSWPEFKKEHYGEYLEMLRDFEVKKRKIGPTSDSPLNVPLPNVFVQVHREITGHDIKSSISESPFKEQVKISTGNKLRINADCARSAFFGDVIARLRALLRELFDNQNVADARVVLLVGGFGESEMVQACVRESCPDKLVIVPDEAGLAVVKGAVIYGHDASIIEQRIVRYTYGKREILEFNDTYHQTEKVLYPDGVARVHGFKPLINQGDTIPNDYEVEMAISTPVRDEQTDVCIRLYAVDTEESSIPRVVDHPMCIKLGRLVVPITDKSIPREEKLFKVKFKFGETEISASVTEQSSGRVTDGEFDFLG